jgi:AhpD family alkylhydroperoxidase
MKGFKPRIYRSLQGLITDLKAILAQRQHVRPLLRGELIDPAFRERLMLAVTAVNGCRYCSYAHAGQALIVGLSDREVAALLEGVLAHSPCEQLPALLYAQHWAETDGRPAAAARGRLVERYGQQTVAAMELALRAIHMANLLGNTLDYALYRLSFGRWARALRNTQR